MENNVKNNQNRFAKYFHPKLWYVCSLILGVLCLSKIPVVGAILVGIGIAGLCYLYIDPVTDKEFDKMFQEELEVVKKAALKKLSIDSSEMVAGQEIIYGPRFRKLGGAEPKYKKGGDDIARYTPVDVIVFIFTKKQIASYQCCLDLLTGNRLSEATNEFFYQDIVSVATETDTISQADYSKLDEKISSILGGSNVVQKDIMEEFKLTSSGGNSISVTLSSDIIKKKYGNTDKSQNMAERVIQVIRKLLRDKKS